MGNFKRAYVQNNGALLEDSSTDLTTIPDKTFQLVNAGETTPSGGSAPGEAISVVNDVGASLTIADYDAVRLVFRDSDIEAELDTSPVIPVSELGVSRLDYAAPQQQQTDVDIPAAPSNSDEMWRIKVTAEESGTQPFPRRSFEVEAKAGESAQTVAQKFAEEINTFPEQINDENEPSVSANANSGVLEITATDVGDIFDVATRGFEANSITVSTNPTEGVGTPEQLRERENEDDGTVGRYVQSDNLLGTIDGPPVYTQPNGTYELITFTFDGDSEKAVNNSIARQTYILGAESSLTRTNTSGTGDEDYKIFLDPVVVASG